MNIQIVQSKDVWEILKQELQLAEKQSSVTLPYSGSQTKTVRQPDGAISSESVDVSGERDCNYCTMKDADTLYIYVGE